MRKFILNVILYVSLGYLTLVNGFLPSTFPSTKTAHSFSISWKTAKCTYNRKKGIAQANLADRFFRVVKANVNNLITKMEDPEKVLEQAVDDMQKDLIKIRQSYAEVSATQKRMERQKESADGLADQWYKRAQLALEKGDEELAREALARRQQQVDVSNSLKDQMTVQSEAIEKLFQGMQQLEAKIMEAKSKKDQMVARARTAKTTQQVNDMLSNMTGNTSMDAFDKMTEKVEMLESKAEIAGQLAGTEIKSTESQFKMLSENAAIDDELQKMKGLIGTDEKMDPSVDDELEKLRKDLNK